MEGMNACAECGFTTTNFSEFASHIEEHEKTVIPSWSGESSPSTSPRGSSDSGISSSGIAEESVSKNPDSPVQNFSASDTSNMFIASNPFAGLSMVAAAMAAVSNSENLQTFSHIDAGLNLSSSQQQHLSEDSSPETPPKHNGAAIEDRDVRNKAVKSEKVMHSCPHCNFTTVMSQHMKSHLEAHERHQGSMYQCDICKMQFSQKANMHRHRMRHSGVKPYECRFCLKKFFRKDQMQEHSMTHIKTGDDFDCPVADCNRQFSQHSALRTHLEDQHIISATQQASCKRCSLLFSNSRRLLLHYQTKHDDVDAILKRSLKEESPVAPDFCNLSSMDLNTAMQLLTGTGSPTLNGGKPPAKKRRNGSSKRSSGASAILPSVMDDSQAMFAATMASLSDNMPLDMSRHCSQTLLNGHDSSNATTILHSPKIESDSDDIVVDICSTDSETKKDNIRASASPPKLPKAESPDYEKVIANNYSKFASLRPEFAPFMNHNFSTFFMTPKPEPLLWTPETHVSTTITSLPSSTVSNSSAHGADELSASTTHSPSAESRSSSGSVDKEPLECGHCGIVFNDRTLHLLHKGLHSAQDPWKCNLCGAMCYDKYVFTSHIISSDHQ
uniref:C2H2-type domain-containing protein n=1 Tax=Panagrolaimus sp. JU765 TaxID=591449 RepID=A0AC34QH03_9BILA